MVFMPHLRTIWPLDWLGLKPKWIEFRHDQSFGRRLLTVGNTVAWLARFFHPPQLIVPLSGAQKRNQKFQSLAKCCQYAAGWNTVSPTESIPPWFGSDQSPRSAVIIDEPIPPLPPFCNRIMRILLDSVVVELHFLLLFFWDWFLYVPMNDIW